MDLSNSSYQLTVEFWQQWLEHEDYLWRCCLRQMGNPIEAEDALSEALLKAQKQLQKRTERIRNWRQWLVKVTWNHCTDILRQRDRQHLKVENVDPIALADEWVSREPTPEQICIGWELEEFLDRAMEELPPKKRETLILYMKQQQSYPEVAGRLIVSPVNVRKRISDARRVLRDRLESYDRDSHGLLKPSKKKVTGQSVQLTPETVAPPESKKSRPKQLPSRPRNPKQKLKKLKRFPVGQNPRLVLRNPPKEEKSGFDPIASIAYLEGDRTYLGEPNTSWVNIYPFPQPRNPVFPKIGFLRTPLGEPNTLWETYTRCWVPLHSTQPTTGERSHLPGGTQHPLGKHIPLSSAKKPGFSQKSGFSEPPWGNPTRCG